MKTKPFSRKVSRLVIALFCWFCSIFSVFPTLLPAQTLVFEPPSTTWTQTSGPVVQADARFPQTSETQGKIVFAIPTASQASSSGNSIRLVQDITPFQSPDQRYTYPSASNTLPYSSSASQYGAQQYGVLQYETPQPRYGTPQFGITQNGVAYTVSHYGSSSGLIAASTPAASAAAAPVTGAASTPAATTGSANVLGTQPSTPATNSVWDPFGLSNRGPIFNTSNTTGPNFMDKIPEKSKFVARRFVEKVSMDYTLVPGGSGDQSFGFQEVAYQTAFIFPCRYLPNNEAFVLSPGAELVWWDGPIGPPVNPMGMSPNGFGAYLDLGTKPRYGNFGFDLSVRYGAYSDFNKVDSGSFRLEGSGAVILGLTNNLEGVLGVDYINRNRIKMMPRIGVVWKPSDVVVWHLVFPDPKISRRLTVVNNMEWWGYIQGRYGGGRWSISDNGGDTVSVDYNDILLGLGLEFTNHNLLNGYVEFGGAFNRELYSLGKAWCEPSTTVYLKAGFHF